MVGHSEAFVASGRWFYAWTGPEDDTTCFACD
jgi:hypothetical protein